MTGPTRPAATGDDLTPAELLLDWTWWANVLRQTDGGHDKGAGEHAAAIVERIRPVVSAALSEAALLARPVEPRYREALERIARADISQHVRNIVRSALGDDTPEPPRPSRVFDDGGMDL